MIMLKHATSGLLKECPTGFSFTTLLFGFFVPLFRRDFKWAAIMVAASFAYGALLEALNLPGSSAIALAVTFAFYYNEMHIKELLEKGFIPADENSREWLVSKKILPPEPPMGL